MSIPRQEIPDRQERGAALIALLFTVLLASSYLLLHRANSTPSPPERAARTAAALAQAKEALIARAVTHNDRPGSLPCPDLITNQPALNNVPGDGKADLIPFGSNECPSHVGWLPWRTLDLPDPRDASGERLWYAMSSSFRDHPSAQPINSDTATTITLNGQGDIAAIVFAANAPLSTQLRPSNTITDYLDGANADGDMAYVSLPTNENFNDVARPITGAEIMLAVERRVAGEALKCLRVYGLASGNRYPWTTRINSGSGSPLSFEDREGERFGRLPETLSKTEDADGDMAGNWPTDCGISPTATQGWWRNWKELVFYAVANRHKPSSTPPTNLCGVDGYTGPDCLTVNGVADKQIVVLVAGRRLVTVAGGQPRTLDNDKNDIDNYLEGENRNLPVFTATTPTESLNDLVRSIP